MVAEKTQPTGNEIVGAGNGRGALARGGIEIRREGISLDSTVLPGGSVYLVVDCSSSMEGEKIAQAKKGALGFAREALTRRYGVGLISFASVATHISDPRRNISSVERYVPRLKVDGSTNMTEGIGMATVQLRGRRGPLAMVVVTDGVPNDGKGALNAAQDAKDSGIDVITVGTEYADEAFLQELASRDDLVVVKTDQQLGRGISEAAGMLSAGMR